MKEIYLQGLKEKAILLGWITGFLLLISLLWIATQGVQTNILMRSVNNTFINNNDTRRVSGHIHQKTGSAGLFGYWYLMSNSKDKMFVFTVFQDGILIPLGAVVTEDNSVTEIIPLSAHAIQVFDALPKSILQLYISRIESALIEGSKE